MADSKDEQALLAARINALGDAQGNDISSTVRSMGNRQTGYRMIREASELVKEHISRQPHVQRVFSFMPTMMTRVSPFHFRSRSKGKAWPLVRLDSENRHQWGRMVVTGELLVIFDETILFSLLALLKVHRNDAFETSLEDLCLLSNVKSTTGNRNAVWRSIRRLAGTRIDMDLSKGLGKKRRYVSRMTGSILGYADHNSETDGVRIVFNPYFLEMYGESFITNIDILFRAGLKGDVSKAFYRYFQGTAENRITVPLLNLVRAVNLDARLDPAVLKRKAGDGLRELKSKGFLQTFDITAEGGVQVTKTGYQILGSDGCLLPF